MVDFLTILVNLLLVSIILFIYRQYDKRSRALEKIKKFIDIAKDNLEDFVDDKTKEMNNLAVDMEAYQRSSLEIIKKISEAQEKIKNKSSDFEEVEKKIVYHDSMLKELDDMALKVQDNMKRLWIDGKIVDKLSKTLKGFHSQIDSIDLRLNDVLNKFDDKNKENLEFIKDKIWKKFDESIYDLSFRMKALNDEVNNYEKVLFNIEERKNELLNKGNERIEQDLKDFIAKVELNLVNYNKEIEKSCLKYEDKYKNIENMLDEAFLNAKDVVFEKQNVILSKLNEEIQIRHKEMFDYINEYSKDMKGKFEGKLILVNNEILSIASSFKDNSFTRINATEETIKQEIKKYEEQVADIFDKFRSQFEINIRDVCKEYDSRIDQVDKDVRGKIEFSLIDANSRMKNIQENIKVFLNSLENESNKIYYTFKEKVDVDINNFNETANAKIQSLENQLLNKTSYIETTFQEKINKIDNELYIGLKEINDRLSSNYSYLDENINIRYSESFNLLNTKSTDLENEIKVKYDEAIDTIKKNINNFSSDCHDKFLKLTQETERNYQSLENNVAQISVEISNNIDKLKRNYNDEIKAFINEMGNNREQYISWNKELNSDIGNLESRLKKTNDEFINLINIQKDRGKEISENVFNELTEYIEKKVMTMHSSWKEELIALDNGLFNVKTASEELLIKTSSKIEIFEKDVNDRLDYIVLKTSDFENSILQKYKELRDFSAKKAENVLNDTKEFIGNQAKMIQDNTIEIIENFNDVIFNKETLVNNKIEELDFKIKGVKTEYEVLLNNFKFELDDFISKKSLKISEIKDKHQAQIDDFLSRLSSDSFIKRNLISDEIDAKFNEWQVNLSKMTCKIENLLSKGERDISLIDSEMISRIIELKGNIDDLENYYLEKIDEFRSQGSIYADELLKNIMTHFKKDAKELEDSLSKKFTMVLDRSEEFIKEVDSLLQDKRVDITSFQSNMDVAINSLNFKFNEINKEINDKYNEVMSSCRRYSEVISIKLEDEITSEIEKINGNLMSKMEVVVFEMGSNLEKIKESFNASRYDVENFEARIKDVIDKEEIRITTILKDIEQQYNKRREDSIEYKQMIDSDISQFNEKFDEMINEIHENIENKSASLNDLYEEKIRFVETNFENKYLNFLVEAEGLISKTKGEVYKVFTENDERLKIRMSEMDQNFEMIDQRSKEMFEIEENIKRKIQESSSFINCQFEKIKLDIENEIKSQFDTHIKKSMDLINLDILRYEHDISEKINSLKSIEYTFKDIERDLKDKISKYSYEFYNEFDAKYLEFEKKYEKNQQVIEDKINSTVFNVDSIISEKYVELEKKYFLMHSDIEKKINKYMNALEEELNNSNNSIHQEIEIQFKNLEELKFVLNNVNEDVSKLKEETYRTVSSNFKFLEEGFFKDLKVRNEEINSALSNLSLSSNAKIKELEKSIMENIEYKSDFISGFKLEFEQEFTKEKEAFYQEVNKEFDLRKKDMDNRISAIENNVINRIDEFIGFMKNKQSTVDFWFSNVKDDVKNWQEKVYKSIEEKSNMVKTDIKVIEDGVLVIKNDLNLVKNNFEVKTEEIFKILQEETKKIESLTYVNLKNIESDFQERILKIEKSVDSEVEIIDNKISEKIESMVIFIEGKFVDHQKGIEDKILRLNKNLEDEFVFVISKVENEKQELVKRIFNDKDIFEAKIGEVKSEILDLSSKINIYKSEIEDHIKNEYSLFVKSFKNQYLSFENEIKYGFSKSEEELQKIKINTERQIKVIENETKNNYEIMIKDFNLNIDRLQSKVLNYDVEFSEFVDGIRENLASYKKDLKNDIERHYFNINLQLENLKHLESELEDNKSAFDDVKVLKDNIQVLWKSLKEEIEVAEKYKNDFKILNLDFRVIHKEASEVFEVFKDLKVERKNLEEIREDFNKFSEFYDLFIERYKTLMKTYDDMQVFKTRIKEIRNEQENILENYKRIENKEEIIISTIQSIDRNFDLINEIENKIKNLSRESVNLKVSFDDLKILLDDLMLNKDISDKVVRNIKDLKDNLKDIEKRLDNIKEIREKVVKSETRLENLNVAAEERIKTLGILVKTDSKYKDNIGLNNGMIRDSVIKLMKQGWSAEEISRATKLSIGEVELILELGMTEKNE